MSNSLTDQELLKRLVAFDSTSVNSNVPIADFICDYLEAPAPGTRIQRLDGGAEGKLNLLIMKGPEPTNDSGLLFSGHMDVVPAVEPEWKSDPFDLVEKDGALFGRGSADMKGFDALAINIFKSLDASTLKHPFGLLLTCDEEV
ncbi:MAG: M20/M25/M40 family metallo-hydrolase, partial [Planctomycetota bacterium]|nr:M20/M25/M40 family metallo-hydrolase [Planctomycetota bacterium]